MRLLLALFCAATTSFTVPETAHAAAACEITGTTAANDPGRSGALFVDSLAPGVFRLAPANIGSVSVVIVRPFGVVVVDPGGTRSGARDVLCWIRSRTPLPVRYVVDTHWHVDHSLGNGVFAAQLPKPRLVAHTSVPHDLTEHAAAQFERSRDYWLGRVAAARAALGRGSEEGDSLSERRRTELARLVSDSALLGELAQTNITLPSTLIRRRLVLGHAGSQVDVLFLGSGHTRGDLVVFLPAERIAIVGDLGLKPFYASDGDPVSAVQTLAKLLALDPALIVPGHGPVQAGTAHIRRARRELAALVHRVRSAVSRRESPQTVEAGADSMPPTDALADRRGLVSRIYSELAAVPIGQRPDELPQVVTGSGVTSSYETVKVADGIFTFVAPLAYGTVVSGNSTVIIGDSAVLVVDAGHFPRLTRQMIDEIRRKTTMPVRYLVNTHWHPDHWLGNGEYRAAFPAISVVSTAYTRAEIVRQGPDFLAAYGDSSALVGNVRDLLKGAAHADGSPLTAPERGAFGSAVVDAELAASAWRGARVAAPDVTFDTGLRLHLGNRDVDVMFIGRGNTGGDAVVWVPDARVVVTGDLVVAPTPYAYGSFLGEWRAALERIHGLGAAAIVPGHGPIERDDTYITLLTSLLDTVRAQVGDAVRRGLTLDETRKAVHVDDLRARFTKGDARLALLFNIGFLGPGIERAYQEWRFKLES